jgi:hypothetical protein
MLQHGFNIVQFSQQWKSQQPQSLQTCPQSCAGQVSSLSGPQPPFNDYDIGMRTLTLLLDIFITHPAFTNQAAQRPGVAIAREGGDGCSKLRGRILGGQICNPAAIETLALVKAYHRFRLSKGDSEKKIDQIWHWLRASTALLFLAGKQRIRAQREAESTRRGTKVIAYMGDE